MKSRFALENLLPQPDVQEVWAHIRDYDHQPSALECEYALHGLPSRGYRVLVQIERVLIAQELDPLPDIDDQTLLVVPQDCPVTHRQEGDEYVCGKCGLRYDTHEDRPLCPRTR